MLFAKELAKTANLGAFDHSGSLLNSGGDRIANRKTEEEGILIVVGGGILIVYRRSEK
jgi:hypothetical protein